MPGPAPHYRPTFPDAFLAEARRLTAARTTASHLRQRARLVLLLHETPTLSNVQAAAVVDLHPSSIRLWRKRWASGQFSLQDESGRGRKPVFSPPR
jgi:transposase